MLFSIMEHYLRNKIWKKYFEIFSQLLKKYKNAIFNVKFNFLSLIIIVL
jgi:hypothetical protein